MASQDDELKSLAIFAFTLVCLLILATFWCLLSTCLRGPMLELVGGVWESARDTARFERRRRQPFDEYGYQPVEQWEMGTRRNRLG